MTFKTADLCDEFTELVQIADPIFQDYGGIKRFGGVIATVKIFEDNVLVSKTLQTAGDGRVLVVDGGGSKRCALLGDRLAGQAEENGWAGLVIYGCIRDSVDIAKLSVGVKALGTMPKKSEKKGEGYTNIPVHFAGITFTPGAHLYADEDGIIVAEENLLEG